MIKRRFGGDVRREFMQRLYATLHGTLGSYLRDALQKAVLMLWHAFLFLGLRIFALFIFCIVACSTFSYCKYAPVITNEKRLKNILSTGTIATIWSTVAAPGFHQARVGSEETYRNGLFLSLHCGCTYTTTIITS
jgi:hypothetical protein